MFRRTLPHAPARPRGPGRRRLWTPSPHGSPAQTSQREDEVTVAQETARPSTPGTEAMGLKSKAPSLSPLPPAAPAPRSLWPLSHGPEPGAAPAPALWTRPSQPASAPHQLPRAPPTAAAAGPSLPAGVSLSDLISGLGRRGSAVAEWEELPAREGPPPPSASGPRPRLLPPQVGRGHGETWRPDSGRGGAAVSAGKARERWPSGEGRPPAGFICVRRLGARDGHRPRPCLLTYLYKGCVKLRGNGSSF